MSATNLNIKTFGEIVMTKRITLFSAVSFIAFGLSLFSAPVFAATGHDEFAASIDGGKLPPCPSMFKCSVE